METLCSDGKDNEGGEKMLWSWGLNKCFNMMVLPLPHYLCLNNFKSIHICSLKSLAVILDGLVDCMDPDCCIHSTCQGQTYCRGAPDPSTMQHPSSPSPDAQGFYQRVSFLVAPGGTHTLPGENTFNSRLGALERLRNSQLNLELGNRLVTYASLHKSYWWKYMSDDAVVNKHVMKS